MLKLTLSDSPIAATTSEIVCTVSAVKSGTGRSTNSSGGGMTLSGEWRGMIIESGSLLLSCTSQEMSSQINHDDSKHQCICLVAKPRCGQSEELVILCLCAANDRFFRAAQCTTTKCVNHRKKSCIARASLIYGSGGRKRFSGAHD